MRDSCLGSVLIHMRQIFMGSEMLQQGAVGRRSRTIDSAAHARGGPVGTTSTSHSGSRVVDVDGGRDPPGRAGPAQTRPPPAGRAQQVAGHRLGGADRHFRRMLAAKTCLIATTSALSPSGVEVPGDQVVHHRGLHRVLERPLHHLPRPSPSSQGEHVVGIARHPVADHLAVDRRVRAPGVVQLLQDHHRLRP